MDLLVLVVQALVYLHLVLWPSLLSLDQGPMLLVLVPSLVVMFDYRYEPGRFCLFFHDKHDHYNSAAHYKRSRCDERLLHIVHLYILVQ